MHTGYLFFFRSRTARRRRAFCLGVNGFTNPPIGQPLATDGFKQHVGALAVEDPEGQTAVIAEIEFSKSAVQMGLAAILTAPNNSC